MNLIAPLLGSFSLGYLVSQLQTDKENKEKQQTADNFQRFNMQKYQQQIEDQQLQLEELKQQQARQAEQPPIDFPYQVVDHSPYYISYYDKQRKIPLAVDEVITKDHLKGSADRKYSKFHEDKNISPEFQSTLKDYFGAYHLLDVNRGHMSAASNHKYDQKAMNSSFSLANIVPQNADNNCDLWYTFETLSKMEAENNDKIRVISGPIFMPQQDDLKKLKKPRGVSKFNWNKAINSSKYIGELKYKVIGENKVQVPTHLYKIFHIHKEGYEPQLGCFIVPNEPHDDISKKLIDWQVPLEYIEQISGLKFNEIRQNQNNIDYCQVQGSYCQKSQQEVDYISFKNKIFTNDDIFDTAFIEDVMNRKKQRLSQYEDLYAELKNQFSNGIQKCLNANKNLPHWKNPKQCAEFDCFINLNSTLNKTELSKENEIVSQFIKGTQRAMRTCENQEKNDKLKSDISKFWLKESIFRKNIDDLFPQQDKKDEL